MAKAKGKTVRKDIDLDAIRAKARLGQWKPAYIARVLGVAKQTLLGPAHRAEVMEAIEDGKAMFEDDALQQYDAACKKGKPDIMLIFKMKQMGWSDRQSGMGSGGGLVLEMDGADERFLDLVERYMAKQDFEASKEAKASQ